VSFGPNFTSRLVAVIWLEYSCPHAAVVMAASTAVATCAALKRPAWSIPNVLCAPVGTPAPV
jgi:hypothetical protein